MCRGSAFLKEAVRLPEGLPVRICLKWNPDGFVEMKCPFVYHETTSDYDGCMKGDYCRWSSRSVDEPEDETWERILDEWRCQNDMQRPGYEGVLCAVCGNAHIK